MYQSGSVNSGKVKLGISTITDISRPEPIAVAVKEKNISLYSRATSIQQQLATPVRAAPTSHTPFRYPRLPTHPTVQLLYNPHTRPSGIRYYHTPYSTATILTHALQVSATTTHPTVQLQSSHTPFRYPLLPHTLQYSFNPHTHPSGTCYYYTPYSTATILTHTHPSGTSTRIPRAHTVLITYAHFRYRYL